MFDIPIREAVLLFDSGLNGSAPEFAVRRLGHPDYNVYGSKVGACFSDWQSEESVDMLKLRLMIEVWHIAAFYNVPIALMTPELLKIREYRDMLADDVLPQRYLGER